MPQEHRPTRRIAVKWLHLPDGRVLKEQVVEMEADKPVRYYPLDGEPAMTEWLGGHFFWPIER